MQFSTIVYKLMGIALVATPVAFITSRVAAEDLSFYDIPSAMPAHNGDIVRSEPSTFYLDPARLVEAPANVQRIMYRSTDRFDSPIAVTGTVLTPTNPWAGVGQRPVVAFNVGTQGLGDHCAPSRQLAAGTEYEGGFLSGLLARGYGVVVTDYEGLGTPGVHSYLSREVTGRAVLDGIRAAQRLPEAGLPDAGPVAIMGYSQGGGASAAATEIAGSYAPELKLKGTVAGAVPADLSAVAHAIDGSLYFGFFGYAAAGLGSDYGINLKNVLNDHGEEVVGRLEQLCTLESIATFPFVWSRDLTEDGRPLTDYFDEGPWKAAIGEQELGLRKPSGPVLVVHSVLDDVIPYAVGLDLAKQWCHRGAALHMSTSVAPTHAGGAFAAFPVAFAFLEARFEGLPAVSSCWSL